MTEYIATMQHLFWHTVNGDRLLYKLECDPEIAVEISFDNYFTFYGYI